MALSYCTFYSCPKLNRKYISTLTISQYGMEFCENHDQCGKNIPQVLFITIVCQDI